MKVRISLCVLFAFFIQNTKAATNSADTLPKPLHPDQLKQEKVGYTLAKIKPDSSIAVYRNKIYKKESPEFRSLLENNKLVISSYIIDNNSSSGVRSILFYTDKKD